MKYMKFSKLHQTELLALFQIHNADPVTQEKIWMFYRVYINESMAKPNQGCDCIPRMFNELREWYSENNQLFINE